MTRSISIITPSDNQYEDFVRGVNQRFVGAPHAIYLPANISELTDLIALLVADEKRFVVRSSGHCLEDFVYNPSVEVVIDLAQFDYVRFDRQIGAFEVGTATPLLKLYSELYRRWGVTYPGGICYSVTPGGHITGGGWGLLCRQLGLTIDYVCQIEVIWVDSYRKVHRVIASNNPSSSHYDLWWAHMGGGGGTFGVVTRFWLRDAKVAVGAPPTICLPRPPSHVYLSAVSFPWADINQDKFSELLYAYTDYFAEHSGQDDPHRDLASFMVLTHQSAGALALVTQVDATNQEQADHRLNQYLERFTEVLGEGHEVDRPVGEFQEFEKLARLEKAPRLPWLEATRKLATTNTNLTDPSYRQVYKSAYMRTSFTADQVQSLYGSLTSSVAVPGASITLSSYGGQVNAVSPKAMAYPHRSSAYKMMWMSLWSNSEEDTAYIEWNRQCYEDLYKESGGVPVPNGKSDGCYVNYPDRDLNDPERNRSEYSWAELYWKDNYPKLQSIKRVYDPLNIFHHRQSVSRG